MWVFNFHARASLNRLIRKILLQISSLATKKIHEPGDQGADSYPIPPLGNLQKLPAYGAAPTRPGAFSGFKRSQPRGEKPTRGCPHGPVLLST